MLRRFLGALVALAVITLAVPSVAEAQSTGATAGYFSKRSPLRYYTQEHTFSITANQTAVVIGVVPPGGAILRDVVYLQAAAGTGGTSWVATPKKNGTALVSTPGGFTLAAGANKTTNASLSPFGALANPSGGTRPVVDPAQARTSGGESITIDVTLTGVYSVAVTGSVLLVWEPLK